MKKITSLILAVLMLATMLTVFAVPASAAYSWPEDIDNYPMLAGHGTESDPFHIRSVEDFWKISYCNYYRSGGYFACEDCSNSACNGTHEHYFVLDNDIEFTSKVDYGFYPACCYNDSYAFNGTLDGQGHKIKGLDIHADGEKCWALFGRSKNATFKNITFENCTITDESGVIRMFSPVSYGAILVGYAKNTTFDKLTFNNCHFKGKDAGSDKVGIVCGEADDCNFTNIEIDGASSAEGYQYVGSIAGIFKGQGKINGAKSAAYVLGTHYIGGFVGYVVPSGENKIEFTNIERSNRVERTPNYTYDVLEPMGYVTDSMGVFVGVADCGFTGWNTRGKLTFTSDNAACVYYDGTGRMQDCVKFRYVGKVQYSEGGDYSVSNYTTFKGKAGAVMTNASVLSEGNIWIVAAIAVVAIGGVAALVIVKKKKNTIHNS